VADRPPLPGTHKDPALKYGSIQWGSDRERYASIAAGIRVVEAGHGNIQLQILELADGGYVRVASVVPGDSRHLALYRTLTKPESEWGNG